MQDSSNLHARVDAFNSGHRPVAEGNPDERLQGSRDPFAPLDLPDLLSRPLEAIPFIFDPLMVRGDVVCFGGDPKAGKSLFGQSLTLSLITGRLFLGTLGVVGGPYRVLYLDAENHPRLIQRRLKKLANGFGLSPERFRSIPLLYVPCPGVSLDDAAQWRALLQRVQSFKPDLIVFDSFVRFHRRDENSNSEMSAFFSDRLQPLRDPSGAGLLLKHHLSKPAAGFASGDFLYRFRGASDIAAQADQLWGIERKADGERVLTHVATRWEDTASPLSIARESVNGGEGTLLIATDLESGAAGVIREELARAAERGAPRKALVAAVESAGFASASRIVSTHLGRMHERGQVRKRTEGKEVRYWLTEHAPADAK